MHVTEGEVAAWLREDLGHHDVGTAVPGELAGRLVATEPGVAAGTGGAAAVFEYLDCAVTRQVADGARVDPGDALLGVEGPARGVLRAEGVATTLAARAAGIATETWMAVEAAAEAGQPVTVAATRRTTPGLRGLEKRAVAAGGGDVGRLDLSDGVVVTTTHAAALGLADAVRRFVERTPAGTRVAVEATSPEDGETAAGAGAAAVRFLDLPPEEVAVGVAAVPDDVTTAVAGDISHGEVRTYARTGVDRLAMDSLTTAAPPLGVAFEVDG